VGHRSGIPAQEQAGKDAAAVVAAFDPRSACYLHVLRLPVLLPLLPGGHLAGLQLQRVQANIPD
jgi:hypothetical protein